MYIRCLSYILDIRYVYQMSKLYIRCPVYILDIRYAVDGAKEPQWLIVHFGTPYDTLYLVLLCCLLICHLLAVDL